MLNFISIISNDFNFFKNFFFFLKNWNNINPPLKKKFFIYKKFSNLNFFSNNKYLNYFLFFIFSKNYKTINFKTPFYNHFYKNKIFKNFTYYKNNLLFLNNSNNYGLKNLIYFFSNFFLSVFFLLIVVYFSFITKLLPFNKVMFAWICILMFLYWLISGFVFFFKKYQFGKYTSVIQRFWKRTYILFWLIEGGTFSVFLFFTINASQEPFYMFDQISIFKTHLYSWKLFFLKLFPIILLLILIFLIIISIKHNLFSKFSIILFFITFFMFNIVWLEFYQFYHVINFYSNINWSYDSDEHFWFLEQEPRRTRIVNHYVMLLFILKFWHILFIFGFWVFFVLRCHETKRIRYSLLSANYQNIVILYIFVWVFMYPWFKFFFKNIIDSPYYWFYINNRRLFIRILTTDYKLFFYSLYNYNNYNFFYNFKYYNFNYFNLNNLSNFESFKKNLISNKILFNLYN